MLIPQSLKDLIYHTSITNGVSGRENPTIVWLSWRQYSFFSFKTDGKILLIWGHLMGFPWLASRLTKILIHDLARLLPNFSLYFLNFSKCNSVGLQVHVSCLWVPQLYQTMQNSLFNLTSSVTSAVELNNWFPLLS